MLPSAFSDRSAAGRLLALELESMADRRPIVFGLPRCGVPVAFEVAQHLGAPLDVALVRTVRANDGHDELLATVMEGNPPTIRIEPHSSTAIAVIVQDMNPVDDCLGTEASLRDFRKINLYRDDTIPSHKNALRRDNWEFAKENKWGGTYTLQVGEGDF